LYLLKTIKNIRLGFYCLIAFRSVNEIKGQDFHFTQFFANKLFLAPSFAGATQQNRAVANYRNQWPGLPKGFVTYSFSVDHNLPTFNSGIGFMVMRDVAGTGNLGALHLGLYYSYDITINRTMHLRPGIGFNYLQRSVDFAKFTFGDQISTNQDPNYSQDVYPGTSEVLPNSRNGTVDASSSVIFYTKNLTLGVSVDHLMQPNVTLINSVDKYPLKFSAFGVVTMLRKGRLLKPIDETLSLAMLFKNFGDHRQLDLGIYWAQSPLTFGIWYRGIPVLNSDRGDSFAALVGYKTPHFSVGYSYDFTVSNLITSTAGAHEISMAVEFSKEKKRKRMHAVPCPEF